MSTLPACGLYRTGTPFPGREEAIPAGSLIHFHNHSEEGPPIVQQPESNADNRWVFGEEGWLVEDDAFISAMVPLRPEGLYVITEPTQVAPENILPPRSLVQLGYNRRADPILFVGQFEANSILFPTRGFRFHNLDIFERLERANFEVPEHSEPRVLH